MFHPLWEDVGGVLSVAKEIRKKPQACQLCGHSSVVHRVNGACYSNSSCLCGWTRDVDGALRIKSTGEHAGECAIGSVGVDVVGPQGGRCRKSGAKVGRGKRAELLKIPCYFCGGKPESVDHFAARSKGGLNDRSNLVSACHACNGMKGDKTYDELLVLCRQMEMAVSHRTALRRVRRLLLFKDQAKKILSWHEKRMAEKSVLA